MGLFTHEEICSIKREYDFRERLKDNSSSEDSSVFTVHDLDGTGNDSELNITKSDVLAPFNTNNPDESDFIEEIKSQITKKKTIKFLSKLREIDRKFERDNNSNIDNGIYVMSMTSDRSIKFSNSKSKTTSNQINSKILEQMEKMGFNKSFVRNSLSKNAHNSATACYYLLCEN